MHGTQKHNNRQQRRKMTIKTHECIKETNKVTTEGKTQTHVSLKEKTNRERDKK